MVSLLTPHEAQKNIALFMRQQRLNLNITQAHLAERANVSLASLRKFERTGKISFESFIKISFVLERLDNLLAALKTPEETFNSLDELLEESHSKPARKKASPHEK